MAQGMNWGIFSLLGIVVIVLAGVASFFVYVARRSAGSLAALNATEANPKREHRHPAGETRRQDAGAPGAQPGKLTLELQQP
jgi:hypothetical protein